MIPGPQGPLVRDRPRLLANRHVVLHDIVPQHYPALFELTRSHGVADRWQPNTQPQSYEQFCGWLWESTLVQFGFSRPGEAALAGLVRCDLANFGHQTAQLSVVAGDSVHRTGLALMAVATFVDFTLQTYPLRKLYAEVPEYDFAQFASGAGTYFEVEGRLRDHELVFGHAWDTYILAISRSTWLEIIHPLVTGWQHQPQERDHAQLR